MILGRNWSFKSTLNNLGYNIIMSEEQKPTSYREQTKRSKRAPYKFISYKDRLTLIHKVVNEGYSVYRMAIEMNINHSTAKVIMRRYKRQGIVLDKPMPKSLKNNKKAEEKQSSTGKQESQEAEALKEEPSSVKVEEEKEVFPFGPYLQAYEDYYWGYQGGPGEQMAIKYE